MSKKDSRHDLESVGSIIVRTWPRGPGHACGPDSPSGSGPDQRPDPRDALLRLEEQDREADE